ncbi:MAG: transglutaminase family protein, partial [Rubrivivax sp.]|nr:transglutaminase family protein [Rubrivivax sp.]
MIRIELNIELDYVVDPQGADFVFNIHAAHTPSQTVRDEHLTISQPVGARVYTDPASGNRYMRVRADGGPLQLRYSATVDITHHRADPATIAEVPVHLLPPETMGYIYPSRYCQSDRLLRL